LSQPLYISRAYKALQSPPRPFASTRPHQRWSKLNIDNASTAQTLFKRLTGPVTCKRSIPNTTLLEIEFPNKCRFTAMYVKRKLLLPTFPVTPNFTMKIAVTLGKSRTSADSSWVSPGMDHLLINLSTHLKSVRALKRNSIYAECLQDLRCRAQETVLVG